MSPTDTSPNLLLWRRRYVTRFVTVGSLLVIACFVEVLILNHSSGRSWWWLPGLALTAAPAALLTGVAFVAWRHQRNGSSRTLMEATKPTEARKVGIALRRNQPLPEADRHVAQLLVDLSGTRQPGARVWLPVVVGAVFLLNFLIQHGGLRWFYLVAGAGYVASALVTKRGSPKLLANAASQGIYPSTSGTPSQSAELPEL